ncbi:MAG: ParB N-terminal domain-containing protein [Phycisphaerales bacterium]
MQKETSIIRVPLTKLVAHPENPNKMSKANFKKLKNHIGRSGKYEPLIVRKHPEFEDCFEIINGHHRWQALKDLGETLADCVEWQANDDEVRVLLTTLNRLGGKDELGLKIELIKKLSEKYNSKELSSLLPDTKQTIEKLKNITKSLEDFSADEKTYLHTFILYLTDEQLEIIERGIEKAMSKNVSKAHKNASAMSKIVAEWLLSVEKEK